MATLSWPGVSWEAGVSPPRKGPAAVSADCAGASEPAPASPSPLCGLLEVSEVPSLPHPTQVSVSELTHLLLRVHGALTLSLDAACLTGPDVSSPPRKGEPGPGG